MKDHKDWVVAAEKAVLGLWEQYKPIITPTPTSTNKHDSDDDETDESNALDEYEQYCAEKIPSSDYMTRHDSPIAYWLSKSTVWPHLAQIALDLYTTPPCSDELERIFSIGGNTMSPRRRVMTADLLNELLCIRSWHKSGIIDFATLKVFEEIIQATDHALIAEELAYNTTNFESDERNSDHE